VTRGLLAAIGLLVTCGLGAAGSHAGTLISNGRFTEGAGGQPTGWRTEAWAKDASTFEWKANADGAGQISITNPVANDARWCQSVAVEPGATYRISARVRTKDVGATTAGALIAIEPRIADSRDIHGTEDWQTLEVTADAGAETNWDVCLRLGSYANLNTGTAWFTDVDMMQMRPAPARVTRRWSFTLPSLDVALPSSWSEVGFPIVAGLLLAFGLGILGGRHRHP